MIKTFLDKIRQNPPEINVVGDVCIDEYYEINSVDISPEAPIPVYKSKSNKYISRPGMAANVAYQLSKFAKSYLFSFTNDHAVDVFFEHSLHLGVSFHGFSKYIKHIPIKKRFYSGDHQLYRWDIEKDNYGSTIELIKELRNRIYEDYSRSKAKINILSDYSKGFFDDYNKQMWLKNCSIVDPKMGHPSRWEGCTIFKPNAKEARELTGETNPENQLDDLLQKTKAKYVIITQGGDGVIGKSQTESFHYKPYDDVKVNSVIGAGDCFVAMLALAYSQEMDIKDCVELAYKAGSIYVQKKYNEPVNYYDLLALDDPIGAKFVEPEDLAHVKNLVFTNGCFDFGLTKGHVRYLQEAKKLGNKLVVALNSDASVKKNKGANRPYMNLDERKNIIAALDCVDYVISFDEKTPYELLEEIKPSLIVKGGDSYKAEDVVGYGKYPVKIIDYIECVSTTDKINFFKSI